MLKFFNLLQNISDVIKSLKDFPKIKLIGDVDSYNLTSNSLFLDIGSGFGKPVFHSAFQLNCESLGIEVVPARVEYCLDFFYEYLENKDLFCDIELKNNGESEEVKPDLLSKKKYAQQELETVIDKTKKEVAKIVNYPPILGEDEEIEKKSKLKKLPLKKKNSKQVPDEEEGEQSESDDEQEDNKKSVLEALEKLKFQYSTKWWENLKFSVKDATKMKTYSNEKGVHFTHIYSYNKLMNFECKQKMSKILNNTKFKILAWYSNPRQTMKAGLKNVKLLCKVPMNATSTEKFSVYVYMKTK